MKSNIRKELYKTIGLGVMAGMRTFSAPALLSYMLCKKKDIASRSIFNKPIAANCLKVLAIGEMIGDKHPAAPDRIGAGGLTGRLLAGALVGATVYKEKKGKPLTQLTGALLGGAAAIATAYVSFYLRKMISETELLPDAAIGTIEDLAVIAGSVCLLSEK